MYDEWRKNCLEGFDCENPYFDKLYAIKNKLYDFFYPLGISGNDIHSVSRVFKDIQYALRDDGDLSIVISYTTINDNDRDELKQICESYNLNHEPINLIDIFVVFGHHTDLDDKYIKPIAMKHCEDRKFVKFLANRFSYEVLDYLYSLRERFEKEKELASLSSNKYYVHAKQTETMLVDFILSLK